MANTQASTPKTDEAAQAFDDFVRRLTAVAVSIGLGNALIRSKLLDHPDRIWTGQGAQTVILLFIGIVTVVLSWQGFTSSAKFRKIRNRWVAISRLLVDFLIVFGYLILLSVFIHYESFLIISLLIFVLYCIWDFLTIAGARSSFYIAGKHNFKGAFPTGGFVANHIYAGAITLWRQIVFGTNGRGEKFPDNGLHIGPRITLTWTVGIGVLVFFEFVPSVAGLPSLHHGFSIVLLFAYIVGYRIDKTWGARNFDDVSNGIVLGVCPETRALLFAAFFGVPLLLWGSNFV